MNIKLAALAALLLAPGQAMAEAAEAALRHRAIARQLIFELARLAGSVAALPANIIRLDSMHFSLFDFSTPREQT
jgi:hypothetical protein